MLIITTGVAVYVKKKDKEKKTVRTDDKNWKQFHSMYMISWFIGSFLHN